MPEFVLDTSGKVGPMGTSQVIGPRPFREWSDLDPLTRGYVEALFFTAGEEPGWFAKSAHVPGKGTPVVPKGFADLAPETLASIMADCAKFDCLGPWSDMKPQTEGRQRQGGRDFWYTRNGHGCGFWDGGWPEPYASELDTAAKAFAITDVYLGDDGKVRLT